MSPATPAPKRRAVNNLLALAVLSYLTQRPMHPYELGRLLREHADDRSIKFNHGSLYMVVQQLSKAGFVEPVETSREGLRPERTTYALTDAGRDELFDWLRDLVAEPRHEFPHFVAALSLLAVLPPAEAVDLLRRRLQRLAAQQTDIRELVDGTLAQGVHPLFLVEEEYRLTLVDAERRFVEDLVARITDPEAGWQEPWARFHDHPEDPTP